MPVDLVCYIDKYGRLPAEHRHRVALPSAVVRLDSNAGLFDRIASLGPEPLDYPVFIEVESDRGVRKSARVKLDGYGEPLTYLTGAELRDLKVPPQAGLWNQTMGKMLASLPATALVILYWT